MVISSLLMVSTIISIANNVKVLVNCGENLKVDMREVFISDFGVRPWWRRLEADGSVVKVPGTLFYNAPEVILYGQNGLTPAADMWAVGCIGFELLAGQKLFFSLEAIDRYCQTKALSQQLLIIQQVANIAQLLAGCLQINPNDRWNVWILMAHLQQSKPN